MAGVAFQVFLGGDGLAAGDAADERDSVHIRHRRETRRDRLSRGYRLLTLYIGTAKKIIHIYIEYIRNGFARFKIRLAAAGFIHTYSAARYFKHRSKLFLSYTSLNS